MIEVTRINSSKFFLNPDHIETMEATPDTVITLTNSKKIVVTENIQEIIERIIAYRRRVYTELPRTIEKSEK